MPRYYKLTRKDGCGVYAYGHKYILPTAGKPARQPSIKGKLAPCRRGYHVCTALDILDWYGPHGRLYRVTVGKEIVRCNTKHVVRDMTIVERVRRPTDRDLRICAGKFLKRVLPLLKLSNEVRMYLEDQSERLLAGKRTHAFFTLSAPNPDTVERIVYSMVSSRSDMLVPKLLRHRAALLRRKNADAIREAVAYYERLLEKHFVPYAKR